MRRTILAFLALAAAPLSAQQLPDGQSEADFARWLDCKTQEPRDVLDLMKPVQEDFFEAIPVSDRVNKVANMGPEVQTPVALDPVRKPPKKVDPDDGQLSLL